MMITRRNRGEKPDKQPSGKRKLLRRPVRNARKNWPGRKRLLKLLPGRMPDV